MEPITVMPHKQQQLQLYTLFLAIVSTSKLSRM